MNSKFQLLLGQPVQYSREKQGDPTNDVYCIKWEKKESTSIEVNKQTDKWILQNLPMGHPARYSGEKQGDSTDGVYGSKALTFCSSKSN